MKNENKRSPPSESRKIRKPLIEKKRRARINDSLETLKQILLESKTTLKKTTSNANRTAKLEKADILEMTVNYLQTLRSKLSRQSHAVNTEVIKMQNQERIIVKSDADSSTCDKVNVGYLTLIPAQFVERTSFNYILPKPSEQYTESKEEDLNAERNVWRPW